MIRGVHFEHDDHEEKGNNPWPDTPATLRTSIGNNGSQSKDCHDEEDVHPHISRLEIVILTEFFAKSAVLAMSRCQDFGI